MNQVSISTLILGVHLIWFGININVCFCSFFFPETICDEPQIEHGFILEGKSASYGYNSSVRFQCNSGYKLEGPDYLTCEENGWNPPPPLCILSKTNQCFE